MEKACKLFALFCFVSARRLWPHVLLIIGATFLWRRLGGDVVVLFLVRWELSILRGERRGAVPECPTLGRIAQEVVAVAAVTAGKVFLGQTIFVCFF